VSLVFLRQWRRHFPREIGSEPRVLVYIRRVRRSRGIKFHRAIQTSPAAAPTETRNIRNSNARTSVLELIGSRAALPWMESSAPKEHDIIRYAAGTEASLGIGSMRLCGIIGDSFNARLSWTLKIHPAGLINAASVRCSGINFSFEESCSRKQSQPRQIDHSSIIEIEK